jgi:hypothetical protein
MIEARLKPLKAFLDRPLTGKPWRLCAVILKSCLAACAFVILLGLVVLSLNPQVHWTVFVARGSPDPPKDYTGTWHRWLGNGTMIDQEQYFQGKLDGPTTRWDTKGRRRLETSYRAGKLNGTWTSFYENGSLAERSEYTNGLPTGHRLKFFENGTTNLEVFHSRPGARDGPEISWTKAGERKILRLWRDGSPWDGRFWSLSNGNSILRIYDQGRFISETNLGRASPPAYPRGPARAVQQLIP